MRLALRRRTSSCGRTRIMEEDTAAFAESCMNYAAVTDWWVLVARRYPRTALYIGHSPGLWGPAELANQLRYNSVHPEIRGEAVFALRSEDLSRRAVGRGNPFVKVNESPAQLRCRGPSERRLAARHESCQRYGHVPIPVKTTWVRKDCSSSVRRGCQRRGPASFQTCRPSLLRAPRPGPPVPARPFPAAPRTSHP